jgi:hypothetical protein
VVVAVLLTPVLSAPRGYVVVSVVIIVIIIVVVVVVIVVVVVAIIAGVVVVVVVVIVAAVVVMFGCPRAVCALLRLRVAHTQAMCLSLASE